MPPATDCSGLQCLLINETNLQVMGPSYRRSQEMLGWNVAPEDLKYIPEHWFSYPAIDAKIHYLIAIIYIFFMFFALSGNGVVIWIFSSTKDLRTSSNFFIVNLAIADFMMMLKAPIFIYNSFHTGFALGHLYCQIFAATGSMSGILQACTNTCIAYDRYRTISRPMDARISKGRAFLLVLFTWAYALPFTLMPLLEYWGRFVPEGFLTSCSFDYLTNTIENKLFVFFIFIFEYCIPMFLTMFFYSQIVGQVVSHEKALKEQAKKMNVESLRSGDKAQTSAELRIAKVAIGICSLFVASWTPYAVLSLIGAFGNQALLTPELTMIPALCCKLVACIDPYVYAISHPRFRVFMTVDACKAPEVRLMLLMEFIIQPVPVVNEMKVLLGEYDSEHFSGLGILICNILSAQWGKQRKTTTLLISASRLIGVVIGIIVSDVLLMFQLIFRNELQKRLPWLHINEPPPPAAETSSTATNATAS